jgi:NAD(P)H dehydrogenase (quinone)
VRQEGSAIGGLAAPCTADLDEEPGLLEERREMHVYIVYSHPGRNSFTWEVLQSFVRGLEDAEHTFEVGDLYEMGFKADMDLSQYEREMGSDPEAPVPPDVKAEQEKIDGSDALVFVYPVWWSDCPAKLKGWFDRVLTYGYAYTYDDGEHTTSKIDIVKALVLCPAGHHVEHLEEIGIAESMRRVMLNDRLLGVGVREARMEILGGMSFGDKDVRKRNLEKAYRLGAEF